VHLIQLNIDGWVEEPKRKEEKSADYAMHAYHHQKIRARGIQFGTHLHSAENERKTAASMNSPYISRSLECLGLGFGDGSMRYTCISFPDRRIRASTSCRGFTSPVIEVEYTIQDDSMSVTDLIHVHHVD
jgi:hypothetical protein